MNNSFELIAANSIPGQLRFANAFDPSVGFQTVR